MSGPVGVLLDLLFPPKCVFCGRLLTSGERDFCARCQRELPWLEGPEAEQTGEFFTMCASPLAYRDLSPWRTTMPPRSTTTFMGKQRNPI